MSQKHLESDKILKNDMEHLYFTEIAFILSLWYRAICFFAIPAPNLSMI